MNYCETCKHFQHTGKTHDGKPYELGGKCANTKREIKPETNILHLLLSGEFNTDDCKVVEEVF